MNIFKKLKELGNKVSEVEHNIYHEKQDYLEIYERNLELEKTIEERTEELNSANKRMFTLQHIWEMMNSSTPLENVLEAVVNSTQGDLGYVCSMILATKQENNKSYLQVLTQSTCEIFEKINTVLSAPSLNMRKLSFYEESIFSEALQSKKIIHTTSLNLFFSTILPDISKSDLNALLQDISAKSVIIIPLFSQEKNFGFFCVFSSRGDLAKSELEFLSMYSKQIETAITIADLFQAVREQAVTDPLTGLYNRRHFEEALEKEYQRAKRLKQSFSIIGIDLDHLKTINDNYGHNYGDIAIKTISEVLKKNARAVDIPARMGGEEFNVLLPGISSAGAMVAAERIRKSIESTQLEVIGHITASLGVATFLEHTENIEELIELTDQAMYTSKRNGRNRVTLAKSIEETSWQEIAVNTFIDILSKNTIPKVKDVSNELLVRLQAMKDSSDKTHDDLYAISDILTKLYNPMHSSGVIKKKVRMAILLAKRFDISKEDIDKLKIAIMLYDIGNLLLPDELLQKATPLTQEEKERIMTHPLIGAQEILKPISYVNDILPIIEYHHENWDGSGYPNHISKNDIPLISQIILIVDEYFALIEPRPYRSKLSSADAVNVIKMDADKKWNPSLVKEFISLLSQDIM